MIDLIDYEKFTIDISNLTKFNRDNCELEQFYFFCLVVAGKRKMPTAKKLNQCFRYVPTPITYLSSLNPKMTKNVLKQFRFGPYKRLTNAIHQSWNLNLRTVSVEELEQIDGVGPMTSRFFVIHSRPNQNYAILNTYVLSWMRNQGVNAPYTVPRGSKYRELEKIYLDLIGNNGQSIAETDLSI